MKGEERNIHRDLIIRSQQQDSLAQAQLYNLYAKAMYNICRRMMGDEEEARDLLQESFIDVFLKLPTLREVSTFSAWIKRIVVNNCINAIRKRKLITAELDENLDLEDEIDDFEYTEYKAGQVMQAIEALPDGCKTVLNLYLFDGFDHKEIAQILSITESASKAQYCKAKARIRNILDNKEQQYAG
ncbi:MAG: RNA polymerase sigma factor (sigma-70 family) [Cyclobacteriaceae bacterium]